MSYSGTISLTMQPMRGGGRSFAQRLATLCDAGWSLDDGLDSGIVRVGIFNADGDDYVDFVFPSDDRAAVFDALNRVDRAACKSFVTLFWRQTGTAVTAFSDPVSGHLSFDIDFGRPACEGVNGFVDHSWYMQRIVGVFQTTEDSPESIEWKESPW